MTEKLKVSREVAEAIESNLNLISKEKLLKEHAKPCEWITEKYESLNDVTLWEMAKILINGYEVEMTPGEIIKAEYQKAAAEIKKSEDDCRIQYLAGYQYGVQETLRVLETIVEGVNDND